MNQIYREKMFLMDGPLSKIYFRMVMGNSAQERKEDKILVPKSKELKRRKHIKWS